MSGSRGRGYKQRGQRIAVRYEGILVEPDGFRINIVITDLSSTGFRILCDAQLDVGQEVRLIVRKSAPLRACIRWTCGSEAGGEFLEPDAVA